MEWKFFPQKDNFSDVLVLGSNILQKVCKNFRTRFFWCFRTRIKFFRKRLRRVLREVVKTAFNVSEGLCWAICFRKVLILQFFAVFQRKLFWLFKKIVVVKTSIHLSRRKKSFKLFSFKNVFLYLLQDVDQNVIGTSATIFGQDCQNCNLTVRKNFLMGIFS